MALPAFMAEPTANLATVGLVWAFSGESGIAWSGLLMLVGLGIVRDAVQTRWLRGSFPKLRHLLYSPAKDILLLSVWFDAIFNRRVRWRGHTFLIGRMTRLRHARVPRQVRRRVRRVRQIRLRHGIVPPPPTSNPAIEANRPAANPAIDTTRAGD
jgi:ceramide glucosyltransferase